MSMTLKLVGRKAKAAAKTTKKRWMAGSVKKLQEECCPVGCFVGDKSRGTEPLPSDDEEKADESTSALSSTTATTTTAPAPISLQSSDSRETSADYACASDSECATERELLEFDIFGHCAVAGEHSKGRVHLVDNVASVCRVGDVLGKGTFGCVKRAEIAGESEVLPMAPLATASEPCAFALKCMVRRSDNASLDRKRRRQFVTEVQFLHEMSQKHEGIVTLYGSFIDADNYYIGASLAKMNLWDLIFRSRNQRLSVNVTKAVVRSVLKTLCFMHANGWVHSDIKPDNVVLASRCDALDKASTHIQLVDFGMVTRVTDDQLLYREKGGTLEYLSPERLCQWVSGAALRKSDVWAVGVLTLELLVGRWLFDSRAEGKTAVKSCIRRGDWRQRTSDATKKLLNADGCEFLDALFRPNASRRPVADVALRHRWLKK